jgi:hypothetical protein
VYRAFPDFEQPQDAQVGKDSAEFAPERCLHATPREASYLDGKDWLRPFSQTVTQALSA